MILTSDYVTSRQLDKYAAYTKCYINVDEFFDGDKAVYFTLDMLKQLLPYINYENNQYSLTLNEDLNILHYQRYNELGNPSKIISQIDAIDADTKEKIGVFRIDIFWSIVEPFDIVIYKRAVVVQLIKAFLSKRKKKSFAGATIASLDNWLDRLRYYPQPYLEITDKKLYENVSSFLRAYRFLTNSEKVKLKEKYPFNIAFSKIVSHYDTEMDFDGLFE